MKKATKGRQQGQGTGNRRQGTGNYRRRDRAETGAHHLVIISQLTVIAVEGGNGERDIETGGGELGLTLIGKEQAQEQEQEQHGKRAGRTEK